MFRYCSGSRAYTHTRARARQEAQAFSALLRNLGGQTCTATPIYPPTHPHTHTHTRTHARPAQARTRKYTPHARARARRLRLRARSCSSAHPDARARSHTRTRARTRARTRTRTHSIPYQLRLPRRNAGLRKTDWANAPHLPFLARTKQRNNSAF